jgi:integrase
MALVYSTPQKPAINETPAEPPRLLDRLRFALCTKHYSYRTEQAYIYWVRRFIPHHGKRHPETIGGTEIEPFLTHLAAEGRVSASTQTQALCKILFLYKLLLRIGLPHFNAVRAKRPKQLPVVLSRDEVRRLLAAVEGLHGIYRHMAGLLYGSGLRLMECCRLRVKG